MGQSIHQLFRQAQFMQVDLSVICAMAMKLLKRLKQQSAHSKAELRPFIQVEWAQQMLYLI
jgi:hypothetical protein